MKWHAVDYWHWLYNRLQLLCHAVVFVYTVFVTKHCFTGDYSWGCAASRQHVRHRLLVRRLLALLLAARTRRLHRRLSVEFIHPTLIFAHSFGAKLRSYYDHAPGPKFSASEVFAMFCNKTAFWCLLWRKRDVERRNWERSRNWASVHTTHQCLFSSSICRCAHAHCCRGQEQDPSVSRPQHHRHHLWHHHHQPIHRFTRLCCQPGELLSSNFKVMHQQCRHDVTRLIGQLFVKPFSNSLHAKVKTV